MSRYYDSIRRVKQWGQLLEKCIGLLGGKVHTLMPKEVFKYERKPYKYADVYCCDTALVTVKFAASYSSLVQYDAACSTMFDGNYVYLKVLVIRGRDEFKSYYTTRIVRVDHDSLTVHIVSQ